MRTRNSNNPVEVTYHVSSGAVDGGATTFTRIQGPPGSRGRIEAVSVRNVAAITVAAANLLVGVSGDTDKYMDLEIPISAIEAVKAADASELEAANRLEADTEIFIGTDGAATAGDVEVFLTVAWEPLLNL